MDKERQQQAYENYVKKKTPVHNLPANMGKAFIAGGVICTVGQAVLNICEKLGLDKDVSGGWTSMILVVISVLLTGFNIYPRIAKWGGAGPVILYGIFTSWVLGFGYWLLKVSGIIA